MKKTILTLSFLISTLLSFALGDLVITSASVTPNTNVDANGTVDLNYFCKNAGDQPIPFDADFWISSNPTYENTDTYIGASTGATVLDMNVIYNGYVTGISLAGKVTSGTWYIIIRLDPNNYWTEGTAGEANNISATSFVVGSVVVVKKKPDFIITKDSISTTTINAGTSFRVFTTIQNVGDTLAPTSSISVYLSSSTSSKDLLLGSITTAPLAKNATANYNDTFSVPYTYQSDSNKYIVVVINSNNTIAELYNDNNNMGAIAVKFIQNNIPKPDFIITKDSISTTTINAGQDFKVFVTIKNIGPGSAPSSSISVYLSSSKNSKDLLLGSITTATLAPNTSANYNGIFYVLSGYQSDTNKFIVVVINSNKTIAEIHNDSNNIGAIAVKFIQKYIPPPPCNCNLKMDGIFPDILSAYPGDTLPLSYYIRNTSNYSSTATKVHLYLSDDNILSNQDMMIKTFDVPALPSNTPRNYNENIVIPQNASTNTKYMLMKIDLVDSDSTDNIDYAFFDVNPILTTGDLVVNSNTPSGTYQIVGYSNVIFFGQQIVGVYSGQQVLKFGKVTGYKTPANMTITIVANMLNTFDITYEENSGIDNNLTLNSLQILPNPSNGIVTINSNQTIANIIVYDITGKAVHNQQYTNKQNKTEIDLSALNNGIYFIAVQSSNGETSKSKIVLAK